MGRGITGVIVIVALLLGAALLYGIAELVDSPSGDLAAAPTPTAVPRKSPTARSAVPPGGSFVYQPAVAVASPPAAISQPVATTDTATESVLDDIADEASDGAELAAAEVIDLPPGGWIAGVVRVGGKRRPGAVITAQSLAEGGGVAHTTTGADGAYQLGPLPSTMHLVIITAVDAVGTQTTLVVPFESTAPASFAQALFLKIVQMFERRMVDDMSRWSEHQRDVRRRRNRFQIFFQLEEIDAGGRR
jgi:hypothetical protein